MVAAGLQPGKEGDRQVTIILKFENFMTHIS